VNPFELFLIYTELVEAEETGTRIDYMIDQSHNVEAKIEAMILSVTNLQEAYARALLVDRRELADAQASGDVLGAHRVLREAYDTDVRPLCAKVREDLGAAADPIDAFRRSGYLERIAERRREGAPAGWGS
ncbi:MAG: sugar isomerase, partial [Candidatus Dormibacteraeota bacterium]|nr:sugar isomerase [Candidatus Dormibacteraeota bacterium]